MTTFQPARRRLTRCAARLASYRRRTCPPQWAGAAPCSSHATGRMNSVCSRSNSAMLGHEALRVCEPRGLRRRPPCHHQQGPRTISASRHVSSSGDLRDVREYSGSGFAKRHLRMRESRLIHRLLARPRRSENYREASTDRALGWLLPCGHQEQQACDQPQAPQPMGYGGTKVAYPKQGHGAAIIRLRRDKIGRGARWGAPPSRGAHGRFRASPGAIGLVTIAALGP